MAVGDGDGCGSGDGINEPVGASGHRDMVNPDVAGPEDGDAITITHRPQADVIPGIPDHSPSSLDNVVDAYPMDDDVPYELQGDPGSARDQDIDPPSINRLVAGHDELLVEPYDHAIGEDDPLRPFLDDRVPQRPRLRVRHVIVQRAGYHIVPPEFSTPGLAAEPKHTVGKPLPVPCPVAVAPPAPVDWVGGNAWPPVLPQGPPCAVASSYSPFHFYQTTG